MGKCKASSKEAHSEGCWSRYSFRNRAEAQSQCETRWGQLLVLPLSLWFCWDMGLQEGGQGLQTHLSCKPRITSQSTPTHWRCGASAKHSLGTPSEPRLSEMKNHSTTIPSHIGQVRMPDKVPWVNPVSLIHCSSDDRLPIRPLQASSAHVEPGAGGDYVIHLILRFILFPLFVFTQSFPCEHFGG